MFVGEGFVFDGVCFVMRFGRGDRNGRNEMEDFGLDLKGWRV